MKLEQLNEILEKENEIIKLSHERISKAKRDYVKNNSPFKIGEKVKITDNNNLIVFGFIENYRISYSNRIEPIIVGIKKDGSKSSRKIFIWGSEKIEKA